MKKQTNSQEEQQPKTARVYCTVSPTTSYEKLVSPTEDNLRALITETIQDDFQGSGPIYQALVRVLRAMKANREL